MSEFGLMPQIHQDPFANLDILCATMVCMKKEILLECDFSMCLDFVEV